MNNFQKLTAKLMNISAFKNTCKISELRSSKNIQGRTVFDKFLTVETTCVISEISSMKSEKFNFEITDKIIEVPYINISMMDFSQKFSIEMNGKEYNVLKIIEFGFTKSQPCTIRFICRG